VLTILRCSCALAVCASVLAIPAAGQTLTDRLMDDAQDGRLDDLSFIDAALIASGVEDQAELDRWLTSYEAMRGELLAEHEWSPSGRRLSRLLTAIQERLLVGRYDAAASDVRNLLARGDFNCLSLTAIALDICEAAQCDVQICLTRGHVALRPTHDGGVAEVASRGVRCLTPVELLGKLYYNRGIVHLREQRFAEGIELLETSLQLDANDEDARVNIAAGLNNWAVDCLRAKRLTQAATLIDRGRRFDPVLAPLIANERLVRAALRD
jgi:hypothetical protein